MATDKPESRVSLTIDPPPRYGSPDTENLAAVPAPQESPPPYLPSPGPPPAYKDVVNTIRRTREESDNYPQFLKNLCTMVAGTLCCTICLGIFLAIPISLIVIGAIYKDQCPIQPKIPIYLIVLGSFGMLKNLLDLCRNMMNRHKDEEDSEDSESKPENRVEPCGCILSCFLVAWFIAGNVWIYSIYKPSFDPSNPNYCNQTLYLFAFWITTSGYIIIGCCCLCCCCLACAAACMKDG